MYIPFIFSADDIQRDSILLDIKIFRIHGRFRLFKAFKTFQTEMKLPFFDPALELFFLSPNLFVFFTFICFPTKTFKDRYFT